MCRTIFFKKPFYKPLCVCAWEVWEKGPGKSRICMPHFNYMTTPFQLYFVSQTSKKTTIFKMSINALHCMR